MCDADDARIAGWQGWLPLLPASGRRQEAWRDLSHVLGPDTPVPQPPLGQAARGTYGFPQASFERFRSMPEFPSNITRIGMVVHYGTHVDAPNHFIADGPGFDQVPLERLSGTGRVIRLDCEPLAVVTAEILQRACSELCRGEILAIDTGWDRYGNTSMYDYHPSLDEGAALWLLERGIKLLAVDFPSPDLPIVRRGEGFGWPVHRLLLSHGILIAENLILRGRLEPGLAEFIFAGLNIAGADGAPARVLGRPA